MNYKLLLYIFFTLASIFGLSGINFNKFIKTNKALETKVLMILLGMSLSYLITNFIIDFINSSIFI